MSVLLFLLTAVGWLYAAPRSLFRTSMRFGQYIICISIQRIIYIYIYQTKATEWYLFPFGENFLHFLFCGHKDREIQVSPLHDFLCDNSKCWIFPLFFLYWWQWLPRKIESPDLGKKKKNFKWELSPLTALSKKSLGCDYNNCPTTIVMLNQVGLAFSRYTSAPSGLIPLVGSVQTGIVEVSNMFCWMDLCKLVLWEVRINFHWLDLCKLVLWTSWFISGGWSYAGFMDIRKIFQWLDRLQTCSMDIKNNFWCLDLCRFHGCPEEFLVVGCMQFPWIIYGGWTYANWFCWHQEFIPLVGSVKTGSIDIGNSFPLVGSTKTGSVDVGKSFSLVGSTKTGSMDTRKCICQSLE